MKKKYYCEKCKFSTYDKSKYLRHKKSDKHKQCYMRCEFCGKPYKHKSSLSRHLKKCSKNPGDDFLQDTENQLIIKEDGIEIKEKSSNNEIVNNNNNEVSQLIKIIKDQQRQLDKSHELMDKVIKETIPRIGNNNNNSISINVYLNEKCKNAMNLTDFVDKINVSLEDLAYTQQHGYIEGITNIFTKQLRDLSPNERPIHCSDTKRLQFYVKDDDQWKKDNKHLKLDKSLNDVKIKQMKRLKHWEDLHPEYLLNEHLLEQWQLMVKEIIGPEENKRDKDKNLSIIKKQIATNTILPEKLILKNK